MPILSDVIVHLNGALLPIDQARISPLDRGFIFGDGVYEGLRSFAGRMHAMDRHIARMRDGLGEARIPWDPSRLTAMSLALIEANALPDAFVYWHVSRGAPAAGSPVRSRVPCGRVEPTVFGFCTPQPALDLITDPPTCAAAVREDTRWTRGHLKSTSMLGNVLAAIEAAEHGSGDALLVRDGLVGEGTCANLVLALPASEGGGRTQIVTPSLESVPILAGVTRALLLELEPEVVSRPVGVQELPLASEIMLVGTTAMVTSIVRVDDRPVGGGQPGPVARHLLGLLKDHIRGSLNLFGQAATADQATQGLAPATLGRCSTQPAVA